MLLLPAIALSLRYAGYERTRALIERFTLPAREVDASAPGAVSRLVGIAARRGPYRATCLPRSLLLWWQLCRRGFGAQLRMGVTRHGEELYAHAWVELGGTPLNDADDVRLRYAAYDRDFASPASDLR
jgi:hypothetical protein